MTSLLSTRLMKPEDIDAVLDIQLKCYDAAKLETRDAFLSKLVASPQTCFVAVGLQPEGVQAIVGYIVSVPADADAPVPLNAQCFSHPVKPNALYLHDLAVDPASRGTGVAAVLLSTYFTRLRETGFSYGTLTAVNDSAAFWRRHGFSEVITSGAGLDDLAAYGSDARYMKFSVDGSAVGRM